MKESMVTIIPMGHVKFTMVEIPIPEIECSDLISGGIKPTDEEERCSEDTFD